MFGLFIFARFCDRFWDGDFHVLLYDLTLAGKRRSRIE